MDNFDIFKMQLRGLADVAKAGAENKNRDNESAFSFAGAYYRAGVVRNGNILFWQEGDGVKKQLLREREEGASDIAKTYADKKGYITLYRGMSRDEAKEMKRTRRGGYFGLLRKNTHGDMPGKMA